MELYIDWPSQILLGVRTSNHYLLIHNKQFERDKSWCKMQDAKVYIQMWFFFFFLKKRMDEMLMRKMQ